MFVVLLFCVAASMAAAQDPAERVYNTPALNPKHKDKPKVKGWAEQRVEEKLNRGMAAVPTSDGKVYLGWRLLKSDPPGTAFNVYRSVEGDVPMPLNKEPVTATTDFVDEQPALGRNCIYFVRPVVDGQEADSSAQVKMVDGRPAMIVTKQRKNESGGEALLKRDAGKDILYYTSIKFQGDYTTQRIAVADLNGDGTYDFVIKQPSQGIDPAGRPNTSGLTYKLEAYLADGTFLWRKDLGPGIEPGIWYSPYVVYDFDGDGKAEVAVKTGPEDAREPDGRVRKGPEWVSILDGITGREITRADWPPRDPRLGDYNRTNRNQMGVAYLDGKTPCLLVARGTYKLMVVDAYQYHDKKLERLWHWEGDDETPIIRSQGAHGMHSADVDEDGRDEVVLGSCVLDDNGVCLWSVGLGHPDKCFVTDVDPTRPGLEVFYAIEPWHDDGKGVCLVEAKTGKMIWSIGQPTTHVGDGMVADIDPSIPGLECWAGESAKAGSTARYLFSAAGKLLATGGDVPGETWLFWDGDLLRETIAGGGFGGGGFGRGAMGRGGAGQTTGTLPSGAGQGRGARGRGGSTQTASTLSTKSTPSTTSTLSTRSTRGGPGQTTSTLSSKSTPSTASTLSTRSTRGGPGRGNLGPGGFGFGGFSRGPSSIVKYKDPTLTTGIEGRVIMMADILGDWREELVTVLPGELRIYTTTIPARDRRVCLMQDGVYRAEVAHRSMGYEQSPVTSYYLGVPPAASATTPPTITNIEKAK
jgi:hypothetical protein